MPTTRSSTKRQTKLEDFEDPPPPTPKKRVADRTKADPKDPTDKSTKRRQPSTDNAQPASPPSKKQKQQDVPSPIIINRAPVLQLWGAVLAQFLHSDLSWPACLSIGSAISSLCAISKGRAIGMIEPKDDDDESESQKREKAKAKQDTRVVSVMGFPLHLKDDTVVLSGKPKAAGEAALKGKFGDEGYERAKGVMAEAVKSWDGEEDELDKKAFHMYERFRPNVAKGQQGWGRKGELDLSEVASVIKRPSG